MTDGAGAPRRYLAYLLRMWASAGATGAPVWQASLEAPRTHERRHFADLASLVAYLQAEIEAAPPAATAPPAAGLLSQGEPPGVISGPAGEP